MRRSIVFGLILFGMAAGRVFGQTVVPAPVVETDLRDNTIKMRSIDLERVKRDANKLKQEAPPRTWEEKFSEIKDDFEKIQKVQDNIVKIYTTQKIINYELIGKSALDINKRSRRLQHSLFANESSERKKTEKSKSLERLEIRDLIVRLDNAIGKFIGSPIFKNTKVVDPKISKTAEVDLEAIIGLSNLLSSNSFLKAGSK